MACKGGRSAPARHVGEVAQGCGRSAMNKAQYL